MKNMYKAFLGLMVVGGLFSCNDESSKPEFVPQQTQQQNTLLYNPVSHNPVSYNNVPEVEVFQVNRKKDGELKSDEYPDLELKVNNYFGRNKTYYFFNNGNDEYQESSEQNKSSNLDIEIWSNDFDRDGDLDLTISLYDISKQGFRYYFEKIEDQNGYREVLKEFFQIID